MDYQSVVRGRDERVPPKSEPDKQVSPRVGTCKGHACRARENGVDRPMSRSGSYRHVPPRGACKKVIPPIINKQMVDR